MRKLISALLILSMLVCMIPGMALTTSAEGAKIEPDISWFTFGAPNGTTFYLYDAADLLGFAQILTLNGTTIDGVQVKTSYDRLNTGSFVYTFKLANDIDLNPGWDASSGVVPANVWPSYTNKFNFHGAFDGDGHTIKGIYCENELNGHGIFGQAYGRTVDIKNVSIVNSYYSSTAANGAFFIGFTTASPIINIDNVYINATLVSSNTNDYMGGFIGFNTHENTNKVNITITNSVFDGTVNATLTKSANYGIGGFIAGNNSKGDNGVIKVENCASYMTVNGTASDASKAFVGGIVGFNLSNTIVIKNCISSFSCNLTGTNVFDGAFAGGSRYTSGAPFAKLEISNSFYKGIDTPQGCTFAQNTTNYETSGDNYNTTVGSLNTVSSTNDLTTAVSAWTDWDTSTGKPLPKTVAETLVDPVTEVAGYQATDATGDKFSFRIVAVIDLKDGESLADYEEVGFKVSATYAGLSTPMTKDYSTTTVYTSVTGDTATGLVEYTAEDLGGDYIFALACKNVPANVGEITVTVTSYYKKVGGSVVDGATQTLIVSVPKDAVN